VTSAWFQWLSSPGLAGQMPQQIICIANQRNFFFHFGNGQTKMEVVPQMTKMAPLFPSKQVVKVIWRRLHRMTLGVHCTRRRRFNQSTHHCRRHHSVHLIGPSSIVVFHRCSPCTRQMSPNSRLLSNSVRLSAPISTHRMTSSPLRLRTLYAFATMLYQIYDDSSS